MIDKNEVNNVNKNYGFKVKIFENNNIILIDSGLEEWMIEYLPLKASQFNLELKHKNKSNKTNHYHTQRFCKDYDYAFNIIHEHKQKSFSSYNKVFNIHNKLKELSTKNY